MKHILVCTLLAVSLAAPTCQAAEPEFKFGLEWGFALTVYRYFYEYYYDQYGPVMETDSYLLFFGNGQIMGNAGICFSDKFRASLHCGYMGIHKGRHMIPVLARFTFYPKGYENNGFLCFADAGPAFGVNGSRNPERPCIICNAGCGWRIMMSSGISMDLLVSARGAFDNPSIWDPYTGEYLPADNIRRSVSDMCALEFSVGLNF